MCHYFTTTLFLFKNRMRAFFFFLFQTEHSGFKWCWGIPKSVSAFGGFCFLWLLYVCEEAETLRVMGDMLIAAKHCE